MYDLILKNGQVIDVSSREIFPGDILIKNGIIVEIGNVREKTARQVIDVNGKYIVPGFIDFHLHVESSMLSPLEFAREAVRHGTTAIFVDPHEIANVCGRKGINFFLDQSRYLPLDMYVGIPSCVPATHMETSGATISLTDIQELIPDKRVYGLAEMMNFPGIIQGFGDVRQKVDLVYNAGKIVDGHCPGVTGEALKTYVSNGRNDDRVRIMSDHETTQMAEAVEKIKSGMFVGLRYGSASRDMDRILPDLITKKISLDRFMLCSDDLDPLELFRSGHIDRIIRRARDIIQEKSILDLKKATITAISLATQNPGKYFSRFFRSQDLPGIGEIKPGWKANLVVLDSLESFEIEKVIYNGQIVVDHGAYSGDRIDYDYSRFLGKLNIGKKIHPLDFQIAVPDSKKKLDVRVIEIIPGSILTAEKICSFVVMGNELKADPEKDIAKIAVFERHQASGNHSIGFVKNLGIQKGAMASTIAHDSHNLIVAGVDDRSMARAVNHLIEKGGGMVVVSEKISYFPLKICGLMSTSDIEVVVKEYQKIKNAVHQLGSKLENTFLTMAFLALPVIPKLKITDKGLVDVENFQFVSLF